MAVGKNLATGRSDAAQNAIMKVVRNPKFVDNGVRHAVYSKQQSGFTVAKPVNSDFMPTHNRKYQLIEEEDTIRLLHNTTDGHKYTGAIFLNDERVSTNSNLPPILIGTENTKQALVPSSIEASTEGTRYRLENLKGNSLEQLGFTNKTIHIGQKVNVGLRTSDLVGRVLKKQGSSIGGLNIPNPSAKFVAQDFYGTDALSAVRFLSKHDGYNVSTDQFGNVDYSHNKHHGREHRITNNMVTEGSIQTAGKSQINRVVVRGKPLANNDQNVVQVDDFGFQGDTVNEIPGGIFAPTAVTKSSAKAIGRKLLAMAKRADGNERLQGVLMSSRVQPGDVISYDTVNSRERKIVLSTRHYITEQKSEIDINSVNGSIEDIIQRFQEVDISSSTENNEERNRQFKKIEFSTSFGYNIKTSWQVEDRKVQDTASGIILGNDTSNTIHSRIAFQSTGILINNSGGHAVGTTVFTTDGTNANSVFTSSAITAGIFAYRSNGNLLGKLSSATTTTFTLTKGSPDLVKDNEEILLISTDSIPSDSNENLKIKLSKGRYSNRRRG